MVLAVAILSTLLGLAIPALGEFSANSKLRAVSSLLMTTLARARMAAADGAREVVVCPMSADACLSSTDWSDGWFAFAGNAGDLGPAAGATWIDSAQFNSTPAVTINSSGGRRRVVFQPDGSAAGSNTTFRLCLPGTRAKLRQVIVSNVGRARTVVTDVLGCPDD